MLMSLNSTVLVELRHSLNMMDKGIIKAHSVTGLVAANTGINHMELDRITHPLQGGGMMPKGGKFNMDQFRHSLSMITGGGRSALFN